MALASVHVFRTLPGQLMQHMALSDEGRTLLQELGYQAFTLQPIAGSDVGSIATVIQHADNREFAKAQEQIQANERWQEFWVRASSQPAAELIETSLFTDTDPTYVPATDRALGVLQSTQWRPNPGRLAGFMENVATAKGHIERLGGTVRVMQCMTGKYPMTAMVSVTFEDLEHFGEYGDKLAADEQFQNYWAGVMADPTAAMIRSGIYQITI